MMRFKDRKEAGAILADHLLHLAGEQDLLVLALPRGGVPVGYEVASQLHAPLDIILVRKLGLPGHDEFAMGAIASGGVLFLNEDVVDRLKVPRAKIDQVIRREREELERRALAYGGGLDPDVEGRTVILVDDGLATGSTMRVAVQAVRQRNPARIVVAVPVASEPACAGMQQEAEEVVCVHVPETFYAVGQWYDHFTQTTDDEVEELLQRARRRHAAEHLAAQ
jgi:putative phosphoribosyl transferase